MTKNNDAVMRDVADGIHKQMRAFIDEHIDDPALLLDFVYVIDTIVDVHRQCVYQNEKVVELGRTQQSCLNGDT